MEFTEFELDLVVVKKKPLEEVNALPFEELVLNLLVSEGNAIKPKLVRFMVNCQALDK